MRPSHTCTHESTAHTHDGRLRGTETDRGSWSDKKRQEENEETRAVTGTNRLARRKITEAKLLAWPVVLKE